MSGRDDGGPAFPHEVAGDLGQTRDVCLGMSLRDYFAAKALQGAAASTVIYIDYQAAAADAYAMADAMLAERAK